MCPLGEEDSFGFSSLLLSTSLLYVPFIFTLPLSLLISPLYVHFAFSPSLCLSLRITVSDSGLTSRVVRGGCCTDGLNRGVVPWVQVCRGQGEDENPAATFPIRQVLEHRGKFRFATSFFPPSRFITSIYHEWIIWLFQFGCCFSGIRRKSTQFNDIKYTIITVTRHMFLY